MIKTFKQLQYDLKVLNHATAHEIITQSELFPIGMTKQECINYVASLNGMVNTPLGIMDVHTKLTTYKKAKIFEEIKRFTKHINEK